MVLELRYRAHETGLPIMRALWLHYPDDPAAVARGDEYLWGRDMLVAPVVEKGATSRKLYLPRGIWLDYWTEKPEQGGREIDRPVDMRVAMIWRDVTRRLTLELTPKTVTFEGRRVEIQM